VVNIFTHFIINNFFGEVYFCSCKSTVLKLIDTPGIKLDEDVNLNSRASSVGIATGLGLDDRMMGVRFPPGAANFSLQHRVQTGSGAHPASYPMGTGCSFPGNTVAWVCS
jgi:hypothetical protein